MWSTSKWDRCMRLMLLVINSASCIAIVYVYITHTSNKESQSGISSEELIQPESLTDEHCTEVCNSRACVMHANMFLRNINENVHPCEDFQSFLCSGFKAKFGDDDTGDMFRETRKLLLDKLKSYLDNIIAEPQSASAKMKTVYDSCVDYGSSELQGIKELKNLLSDIGILNWPDLPENFTFNGVKLSKILGNLILLEAMDYIRIRQKTGNKTQEYYVRVDFYDYIYNSSTNIKRELAVSMLKYFDLEEEHIDMIINDYDLIKNGILKFYQDSTCHSDSCSKVHIDCFKNVDDDWHELCETLGFSLNFNDSNKWYPVEVLKSQVIFFKEFFPFLRSFPSRTLANFIALNLIKNFQPELNFYFRLAKLKQKDFEEESDIEKYELERWKFCVKWITDNMKLPLQNEYFHQYLTKPTIEELANIHKEYSSELIELLNLQNWVDDTIKLPLMDQFQNNRLDIDFVSRFFPNDTYVNTVYEKFLPTKESFFDNVLRIKRYEPIINPTPRKPSMDEAVLGQIEFDVQAAAESPFILEVDFGILLPPFYIPGHINLINRVKLAVVIGHELGHYIFDMLTYEAGNTEKFLEKRQCIRDQFSRFKFQYLNENLNGSKYDRENVPDNIAITLIDNVIDKYSSSEDIILPGLSYSTKQLLYMSSLQIWCAKNNLEKDLHFKKTDNHAPSEYRLIGMAQNSRLYAEEFCCPAGSFMNPASKCHFLDTNSI